MITTADRWRAETYTTYGLDGGEKTKLGGNLSP